MPMNKTPEALLTKHLGREGAVALLGKIDKMVSEGASPAKIETAAYDQIAAYIEKQVMSAVTVKAVPLEPSKPIQVGVHSSIKVNVAKVARVSIAVHASAALGGPPTAVKTMQ